MFDDEGNVLIAIFNVMLVNLRLSRHWKNSLNHVCLFHTGQPGYYYIDLWGKIIKSAIFVVAFVVASVRSSRKAL